MALLRASLRMLQSSYGSPPSLRTLSTLKTLRGNAEVEIIPGDAPAAALEPIFALRHNVLKLKDSNVLTTDRLVQDEIDTHHSTGHCVARWRGETVAAMRLVNARETPLELTRFGWFDGIPEDVTAGGVVEWGRLVANRQGRKTCLVPQLQIESAKWCLEPERDLTNMVGMVDSKAQRLMAHYVKWCGCEWLTDEDSAFAVPELHEGRKAHLLLLRMGAARSLARLSFYARIYYPAVAVTSVLRSPKDKEAQTSAAIPDFPADASLAR